MPKEIALWLAISTLLNYAHLTRIRFIKRHQNAKAMADNLSKNVDNVTSIKRNYKTHFHSKLGVNKSESRKQKAEKAARKLQISKFRFSSQMRVYYSSLP